MTQSPRHSYKFDSFHLDPCERRLLRAGEVIPLTPKVFDTLLLFAENSNLLLTKDEMIKRLWPDSFVEESNLAQNVSVLRRALGKQPNGKPYIETVPKRGYRFIAEVRLCEEEPRGQLAVSLTGAAEQSDEYERRPRESIALATPEKAPFDFEESGAPVANDATPSATAPAAVVAARGKRGAVWSAIALIVVAGAYLFMRSMSPSRPEGKLRLAVLPFHNMGPDKKDDFLSLSLADEVITRLNHISAITVRPLAYVRKYAYQEMDPGQIADELKVDKLLISTFLKEGDELRINMQLLDVAGREALWNEPLRLKYDKLPTVRDLVAQAVVQRMRVTLTPAESAMFGRGEARNMQAYEFHLRGVHLYHRDDLRLAVKKFEESVRLDPTYAPSWAYLGAINATLASIYFEGLESYDKARQACDRALELDPSQIEARIFKGALLTETGRVEEAVPLIRSVIATTPNIAQAHWNLAYAYRFGGLIRESISEGERSRQINDEINASNAVFNAYLYDGQYEKFIQSLPDRVDSAYVTFYRGLGHYYLKRWKDAAAYFDQAYELNPNLMQAQVGKALSHGLGGRTADGLELLKEVEEKILKSGVTDAEGVYKIAQAFAALNDRPAALRMLRRSIEGGFFCHPYFTNDPLLDNLRSEAEFAELMERARARHENFKRQFAAP
ncbi:MAG TPA: winged helix-turn-helix domain-containing protein [Blastocatellia bacterium]